MRRIAWALAAAVLCVSVRNLSAAGPGGAVAWKAQWIGYPGDDADKVMEPAPLLRKAFAVSKPVVKVTAYVCGLGQYELELNGEKVGDGALTPGWTNFARTCLYDTYDVTKQVKAGGNIVGVMLGNGMYNVLGVKGRYTKFTGTFGTPKAIAELAIEYADGTTEVVGTNGSWEAARGPVVFNHVYGGEDYDARREIGGRVNGWTIPGVGGGEWKPVAVVAGPGERGKEAALVATMEPLVKVCAEYRPFKITEPKPGVLVCDFGQNMSGWVKISVTGEAGEVVKAIPGELLGKDGLVTQAQSGRPMWWSYTLKGDPHGEEWTPRFSYYGFRYVQLDGVQSREDHTSTQPVPTVIPSQGEFAMPTPAAKVQRIVAEFVHADVAAAGTFACSNDTINRIHTLINAAVLSNLQSVITDCPHREKLGWLEQTHLMGEAVMMDWGVRGLYEKILMDMREAQHADGLVPDIAPEYVKFSKGFLDSPEWGSACVIDSWLVYLYDGDKGALAEQWEAMTKYVDYLGTTATDDIVSHGLGDWYDIGPKRPGEAQLTSKALTATAVYYQDIAILRKTAALLGKTEDAAKYEALAERVKAAFNARFFDAAAEQYEKGSQTADAMPLAVGLVLEEHRKGVLENLVKAVRAGKNRVTAGDVGFSYVVKALTDGERGDVLFDMVTQADGPGYVEQLQKGATTLTEAWDADPRSSQNHLMLGHAEAWLYRGLAGIRVNEDGAGFERVTIRPQVVGDVTWVKATHETPRGQVFCVWQKQPEGGLRMVVGIPAGVTARVYVPGVNPDVQGARRMGVEDGATVYEVTKGSWTFEGRQLVIGK